MKNILYLFSTLKKSGPINIIINLIEEIDRSKYNPIVLSLSKLDENDISAQFELEKLGVVCKCLNLSRIEGFVFAKRNVLEFCKSNHIETIHLIGFRADILVCGKQFSQFTIVSSVFSNLFADYSMLYGKYKGSLMAYLHLKSLKNKIKVACSYSVKDKLENWVKDDFIVIENSVSKSKFFVPINSDKIVNKQKLNIDPTKRVFIFVGVLISRKDPLTTINAFLNSSIYKEGGAALLILGDGVLREKCEELCFGHNDIYFMGNTPDTLIYLHASDFYISSSLSEGLPTSVLEALSCGLVPVLSNIDSHIEIVNNIYARNLMFKCGDVSGLISCIDAVVSCDYKSLSYECRMVIEDKLNSNIMAKKYQSIYQ